MAECSFSAEEWCATRCRETLGATMVFGRPFSHRLGRKDALDVVMASHCGQAKLVTALIGRLVVPGYPLQGLPPLPTTASCTGRQGGHPADSTSLVRRWLTLIVKRCWMRTARSALGPSGSVAYEVGKGAAEVMRDRRLAA